jgi:serine/threonine protein kinase
MKPASPTGDLSDTLRRSSDPGQPGQAVRPTLPSCDRCQATLAPLAAFCGFCGEPVDDFQAPTVRVLDRRAAGTGQIGVVTVKPGERMLERTMVDEHPPAFDPATTKKMIEELTPGTTVGEWRIERLLGTGSMGAVYGAVHPLIGRRVAVKVLRPERAGYPEATERFVREAQAASRVRHPHVVDVYSFGAMPDGRAYIVMEWLDGQTLRARLGRPLSIAEACRILEHILDALSAIHAEGIVHRDLKPDNIFLVDSPDGPIAKVLDLGLAKVTDKRGRSPMRLTLEGFVVGSADYVAPEQAAGHTVDARADLYSLGVTLFELLTLRRPFVGQTTTDLLVEHIVEEPPSPSTFVPSLPRELDQLVLAMLSKEPGDRPTLGEVRAVLRRWRSTPMSTTINESSQPRMPALPLPAPPLPDFTPPTPMPAASARVSSPTPIAAPPSAMMPTRTPRLTPSPSSGPLFAARFEPPPLKRIAVWRWLLLGLFIGAAAGAFAWWRWQQGGFWGGWGV